MLFVETAASSSGNSSEKSTQDNPTKNCRSYRKRYSTRGHWSPKEYHVLGWRNSNTGRPC
ncbi:hypothetical protein PV327_007687 [Microctonus hyperodae]|uniref:Uncharacterized protein n=1 Tax=Microctonus hyperodae TaxID=165561 RepID=A0AA39KYV5_MICHY|nr:hypothetical protein PV327_007687 [Microctonus hyperodae]